MKHVMIGTAGHVDHGKTVLIKALTGVDTDRLAEEKRRGITIELGFSHLEFSDGLQAGIVDVPGHEKFIRNMLAGAGGVDLAMLVVAADEGIMPQTEEHLEILSLLGVRDGLVVLTKTDLVDGPWLSMVTEEVRSRMEGTFLAGKPIVPVSAVTGDGLETLRAQLHALVLQAAERDRSRPFRLPLDRVFSVDGVGTVGTGTLLEGAIHPEDEAVLVPSGRVTRVRGLQVHGTPVEAAYAGQRVAVNLAGVRRAELDRGETLSKPGTLAPCLLLDVRLQLLEKTGRTVQSGSRVHLHHGVNAVLARVNLLCRESLAPGESCYAQLQLTEPVAARRGDHFVIRFYSPVETIGGGIILDEAPKKHKHRDLSVLSMLEIRESGSEEQKLLQTLADCGDALPDLEALQAEPEQLRPLLSCGQVLEPLPGRYLSAARLEALWEQAQSVLQTYHEAHPLQAGIPVAELRQRLLPQAELAAANAMFKLLIDQGRLRQTGERVALSDFVICLTRRQRRIREQLLQLYRETGWRAPTLEEAIRSFEPKEREDCRQVAESLISQGELILLSSQVLCHRTWLEKAREILHQWFAVHQELTLAAYRDRLGTSRDYALLLLEYFDRKKETKRQGNVRTAETGSLFH